MIRECISLCQWRMIFVSWITNSFHLQKRREDDKNKDVEKQLVDRFYCSIAYRCLFFHILCAFITWQERIAFGLLLNTTSFSCVCLCLRFITFKWRWFTYMNHIHSFIFLCSIESFESKFKLNFVRAKPEVIPNLLKT